MCLRFVFVLITRLAGGLRLSRRAEAWKTAEILILRHPLAVLQRRQGRRPKLTWADRALLATLVSVIPRARRQGLRLLVAPDTIVRWHRDIVRRRWAARSRRRAAETAPRAGRSRSVPRPKTDAHQWPDQRISPGRMTWMRFSARTPAQVTQQRSDRLRRAQCCITISAPRGKELPGNALIQRRRIQSLRLKPPAQVRHQVDLMRGRAPAITLAEQILTEPLGIRSQRPSHMAAS